LQNQGMATLTNTIVANNTIPASPSDVSKSSASTLSGNNNLIGTGGSGGLANGTNGNIVLTNLNDLRMSTGAAKFGGAVNTFALLPGSPAIDAGASGGGIPSSDERGLPRVGPTDIGAFESQGYTFTLSGSGQMADPNTAFAKPLAITV